MEKQKVLLVVVAILGIYLVAAGGVLPLLSTEQSLGELLAAPLAQGSTFDVGLLMIAVVLLAWALLLGPLGKSIDRPTLLSGIALASALVLAACLVTVVSLWGSSTVPQVLGIFTLVGMGQGVVGLAAGGLLLGLRGSRRRALVPLALNGGLTACAAGLLLGPLFL